MRHEQAGAPNVLWTKSEFKMPSLVYWAPILSIVIHNEDVYILKEYGRQSLLLFYSLRFDLK